MRPSRSRRIRITVAAAIAGLATALTVAATAAPASATASTIHAKYKVTGNTFLKAPNATLPLGPGKLAANLEGNQFSADQLGDLVDVVLKRTDAGNSAAAQPAHP